MDFTHSILVCPSVHQNENSLTGELNLDEIRNYLVYWDSINVLSHSAAPITRTPNLNYLRDGGYLSFTNFELGFELRDGITEDYDGPVDMSMRAFQAEIIYDAVLVKAFRMQANQKRKVIAYGEPSWGLRLPPNEARESPTLQINLYKLLPQPSSGTPYEDIIRFKEKRQDELDTLRVALHKLVREVQNDPDAIRGEFVAAQTLANSLRDWNRVSSENRFMRALKGDLRITATVASAAAFYGAASGLNLAFPEVFNIPIDLAFGAGAALPFLEGLVFSGTSVRSLSKDVLAFKYAGDVARKLS